MNSAEIILQSYRKILSLPSERVADVGVSVPIPCFPAKLVYSLLKISIKKISKRKKPLIDNITGKCVIVGDLHGNLHDLIRILNTNGLPPAIKYVFLGDYVDRGRFSMETFCYLAAHKVKYPKHVYLLRGNHESREMAESNTFGKECAQKLFPSALTLFSEVFDVMPVAAVIDTKIFCIHAGLSKGFMKLSDIKKIRRPFSLPETGPLADLFWSDPSHSVQEWGPSQRGNTYVWGLKVAKQFIKFLHTHESLYEFTSTTSSARPYTYDLSDAEKSTLTSVAKHNYELHSATNFVFPYSKQTIVRSNHERFSSSGYLVFMAYGKQETILAQRFINNKDTTAWDYFTSMVECQGKEFWETNFGEDIGK